MLNLLATIVLSTSSITLPGGQIVSMDYLAFDAAHHRLWVPAGNTGNVNVIDTETGKLTAIGGFPTLPSPQHGHVANGTSSATIGDGEVWIGNRADKTVCAVNRKTLKRGECIQLSTSPDGVAWVPASREIWVTTPRDHSITIIAPKKKGEDRITAIKLPGDPEGFAVHGGTFFTNLEDKDQTLAIDVKTHAVSVVGSPGCGAEGPRGQVIDPSGEMLFVACTHGAVTFVRDHDQWKLNDAGRLNTMPGVNGIDYFPARRLLYVASGRDGVLTIAHVDSAGGIMVVATAPTAEKARTVVVDGKGTAYVADSPEGKLIVVKAP